MRTVIGALALTLVAHVAAGQDAAASASGAVLSQVTPGDRITVTLRDGATMRGTLVGADKTLVVRHGADEREFGFDQVERITRFTNGLILGPLIGTAAGLAVGIPLRTRLNNEGENGNAALTASILSGVAIGTLLDALMGSERTIYRRPDTAKTTFSIAPTRHGVAASWTRTW